MINLGSSTPITFGQTLYAKIFFVKNLCLAKKIDLKNISKKIRKTNDGFEFLGFDYPLGNLFLQRVTVFSLGTGVLFSDWMGQTNKQTLYSF